MDANSQRHQSISTDEAENSSTPNLLTVRKTEVLVQCRPGELKLVEQNGHAKQGAL
jgi:hypothetical protein